MRIAVAGGTGTVGRYVVEAVRAAGHEPVVLARSRGVDVVTGTGLDRALDGVTTVIDVTNMMSTGRAKATAFFETATRNLHDAGTRAGVTHHVALSIVGVDRVGLGYYRAKLRHEEMVLAGPVPSTVLRATQFHELAAQLLGMVKGPLVPVPRMRIQPIAAREVATALVGVALADPAGMAPEIAGPEQHDLPDLARRILRARGGRRRVLPIRVPGTVGRALAGGALLPTGPGPRGTETFGAWLARTPNPA
jgi:uncharacterized protein YbjT (DUF2867 family)